MLGVYRFREGFLFKARRLLYHSTPGFRVIKRKKKVHTLWALVVIEVYLVRRCALKIDNHTSLLQGYLAHDKAPTPSGTP